LYRSGKHQNFLPSCFISNNVFKENILGFCAAFVFRRHYRGDGMQQKIDAAKKDHGVQKENA
jgi:hypothetical protein